MITDLRLRNFRGIEDGMLGLGRVTILTGANNSGKSSVMYGLLTLKNVLSNPNQPLDSFFNFSFMNLGGFKEATYLKQDESKRIGIKVRSQAPGIDAVYEVELGKSKSTLQVTLAKPIGFSLKLDVTFPYSLNLAGGASIEHEGQTYKITWNGITPTVTKEAAKDLPPIPPTDESTAQVTAGMMLPVEDIKGLDFVALRRGFVKPIFSPVPIQPQLITEEEIATFIANDRDLEAQVSFYLERIVNKNFQARPTIGTANFYLHTIDRNTGLLTDLVNDGFGTNQLVFLLAKALRKGQTTICIEEPEIHLHPSAIVKLVEVLIDIAKETNRNFVVSTHSEHFLLALLNKLSRQAIAPSDVRVYYLSKEKARTVIEEQHVTEKGQVEGGLKAFYATELDQMKEFLAIEEGS